MLSIIQPLFLQKTKPKYLFSIPDIYSEFLAFVKLIWYTDPQDPGILIDQEQEILIHQDQEILIHHIKFGILIHGLKLAILQRAQQAGREGSDQIFFSIVPIFRSNHLG